MSILFITEKWYQNDTRKLVRDTRTRLFHVTKSGHLNYPHGEYRFSGGGQSDDDDIRAEVVEFTPAVGEHDDLDAELFPVKPDEDEEDEELDEIRLQDTIVTRLPLHVVRDMRDTRTRENFLQSRSRAP